MYARFERVGGERELTSTYAPDGRAGTYFIESVFRGWWCNAFTVMGHVIRQDGRLRRVWFNP